jgi:hypothetical protein
MWRRRCAATLFSRRAGRPDAGTGRLGAGDGSLHRAGQSADGSARLEARSDAGTISRSATNRSNRQPGTEGPTTALPTP